MIVFVTALIPSLDSHVQVIFQDVLTVELVDVTSLVPLLDGHVQVIFLNV